jgi:hypothetical protein
MNAATVSRVMSLIPDRVTRTQSGTAFAGIAATSCVHPERVALLVEFLHWLSPIYPTTRDDQMRFGLFASKQVQHDEDDGEEIAEETAEEVVDLEEETLV